MKNYERECDECNGTGSISSINRPNLEAFCPKCNGKGKIDWIKDITNEKFLDGYVYILNDRIKYIKLSKGKWKRIEK